MNSVCPASSPFLKELAGLDEEQEADKLLIKLRNEVLVCSLVLYVRLMFSIPLFSLLIPVFSYVRSRHDIPSREGKATKRKSWQREVHFLVDSH